MFSRSRITRSISVFAGALTMSLASTVAPAWADTASERLTESATVLKEIMATPDQSIPEDLLKSAYCVVIVPGVKNVGFVVGGKYGRGFAVCRNDTHANWGAPAAVRIEGGSVGFQIGASATDLVMLVMDQSSVKGLLSSQFTLGGGAEVAAGPVGRSGSAQTDATFRAKILSYSRSRGAFAGIALTGATLRQDLDENAEMYGQPVTNKQVLEGTVPAPQSAQPLLTLLNQYAPHDASSR
jgi:lipid-binding SYLF domain-containing protein